MKKVLLRATLMLMLVSTSASVYAQQGGNTSKPSKPPKPGGQGKKPPQAPPPQVPIDGGVSILLAAGVGLGAMKFLKKDKGAVGAS